MKFYEEPTIEVVKLCVEDVITTSITGGGDNETEPW